MTLTKDRKKYIDIIRAFSVCLIFLYHFDITRLGASNPLVYRFANGNWGNVGVFLFFMISGNCLMYKYEEKFELREFLKNRLGKIILPFWMCYGLVFLFNFWKIRTFPEIPIYKFVLTLIGMDGYFSYKTETFYLVGEWFLGCILLLYLIFPLTRWCVKKNLPVTLGGLFIINFVLYYNNLWGFFTISTARNILVGLFYFIFGIGTEEAVKKVDVQYPKVGKVAKAIIFLVGVVALVIKLPVNEYLATMILVLAIYLFFMQTEKMMEWKMISEVVGWLSRNSYMVFLMHHVIINNVLDHFSGCVYSFKGIFCVFTICVLILLIITECLQKWTQIIRK